MLVLAITISFLLTFFTLPIVIRLFRAINFIDTPDRRKIHTISTPSLGGIAIYLSILLTIAFVVPFSELYSHKFLIAGILVALILGIRDDISSLYANQKLVVQTLAALLAVQYAGIRITGFYGMAGLGEVHEFIAIGISIFIVISLTNAFNLIDGIDGLAGSLALLSSSLFGFWFLQAGDQFYSILCFTVASAFAAFLFFNWQPSKIFMGDTGSLVTGFLLSCIAIEFINSNSQMVAGPLKFNSFVAVAISLLIIPIYDTVRVFTIRISRGKSPFIPDKKHIHHILLKQGFSHGRASLVLIAFNLLIVIGTVLMDQIGNTRLILSQIIVITAFGLIFDWRLAQYLKAQREKNKSVRDMYISKSA